MSIRTAGVSVPFQKRGGECPGRERVPEGVEAGVGDSDVTGLRRGLSRTPHNAVRMDGLSFGVIAAKQNA